MAEQTADLAETTLSTGYTAASGTMVVSSATSFPGSGVFSIRVNSAAIYTVTAVAGTTFTVAIEVGSDINLSAGVTVVAVISKRALLALIAAAGGGSNLFGAYASLPGPTLGANYKTSDSLYEFIGVAGPAWQALHRGQPVTVPPSASWTWDNQGGATVDSSKGALFLTLPSSANKLRMYYRTAPGTPYVVTARMKASSWDGVNTGRSNGNGIGFRYAGGKILAFAFYPGTTGGVVVNEFTDSSTFSTQPYVSAPGDNSVGGAAQNAQSLDLYIRIANDGTNLKFSSSHDGIDWVQAASLLAATYGGTPGQIGVFGQSDLGISGNLITLYDWTIS